MNKFFQKKSVKISIGVILAMIFLSLALSFHFSLKNALLIIFGGASSLFLPGFLLSLIFYPLSRKITDDGENIRTFDPIERVIFSILLSISVNTIILLALQSAKIVITKPVFAITIISVNILALGGAWWRAKI